MISTVKGIILVCGALLAFAARPACAAGQIHLAFNDCGGNGSDWAPAICTNKGVVTIVGSVIPPTVPRLIAMEGIVDVAQSWTLSDWWRLDAAGCRSGKISSNFDFRAGPPSCSDPWFGAAEGGMAIFYPGLNSTMIPANSERFDIFCAIDATTPVLVDSTQEFYMFEILIAKSGSVGGCAGCSTPTSLYFSLLELSQPPGAPSFDLSGDGKGQWIQYFDGIIPVLPKSWGAIKALYH